MKFSLAFLVATASSTAAFTSQLPVRRQVSSTRMMATQTDASALTAEAMKISKKFGATSSEAALAWEAVEEVNASDNSVASMGSLVDECEVEIVSQECLEYNEALEELQGLMEANAFPDDPKTFAKELAETVQPIKLSAPTTSAGAPSLQLEQALKEARSITASEGLASSKAAVAWETVEEIAAAGNSNAMGGVLSEDECFVEAAKEACVALEELNKIVGDQE